MSVAVQVETLGKRYRVNHTIERPEYQTLRETLVHVATAPLRRLRHGRAGSCEDFWALRGVSFEICHGEVLGIIGRNGAGKSTLLKILSQITKPTTGCVKLFGRVASLLEVGTGFHQELTGRENIFLNGSILGMRHAEIQRKFDEIVDFSGVERFLDTPIKRYSSGMKVRLAFSVAAHLEPEILIIDEVLAVGDAEFQKKSLGKMSEVARSGRTVLFVSHSMATIQALCSRCALLDSGQLISSGDATEITTQYQLLGASDNDGQAMLVHHPGRSPKSQPLLTDVCLLDAHNTTSGHFALSPTMTIMVRYNTLAALRPVLGIVIKTNIGAPVLGVNNKFIPGYTFPLHSGAGSISCTMKDVPLAPGHYCIDLYFGDEREDLDIITNAISFEIIPGDYFGSGKLPPAAAGPVLWPAGFSHAVHDASSAAN